jgi:hypothetical protein
MNTRFGIALSIIGACLAPGIGVANPSLTYLSVIIDKPSYSSTYSVGVTAYTQSDGIGIAGVNVEHQPVTSDSIGSWALASQGGNEWWSWAAANPRPAQANGRLDGLLEITVTDKGGNSAIFTDFHFQPSAELEFPSIVVHTTATGYRISGNDVENADYYNLWLWDPVASFYPSSQTVQHVADLQEIPFAGLVMGRTYSLFMIANNRFSGGTLDGNNGSLFRSYTQTYLTPTAVPVPEPETYAMLLAGLGLVGVVARRKSI